MSEIIKIDGMSCGHCENRVKIALEELGINVIRVNASEKIAEINNVNKASTEKIKDAIADVGYEVK